MKAFPLQRISPSTLNNEETPRILSEFHNLDGAVFSQNHENKPHHTHPNIDTALLPEDIILVPQQHAEPTTSAATPPPTTQLIAKPILRVQNNEIILEDADGNTGNSNSNIKTNSKHNIIEAETSVRATPSRHNDNVDGLQQQQQHTPLPLKMMMEKNNAAIASPSQPNSLLGPLQGDKSRSGGDVLLNSNNNSNAGNNNNNINANMNSVQLLNSVSSSTAAMVGSHRLRNTTLTEENVAYMRRLDRQSSQARQSHRDRIWGWLIHSGPPFEVEPSTGVPKVGIFTNQNAKRKEISSGSRKISFWRRLFCLGAATNNAGAVDTGGGEVYASAVVGGGDRQTHMFDNNNN